jgi:hypothetical protein
VATSHAIIRPLSVATFARIERGNSALCALVSAQPSRTGVLVDLGRSFGLGIHALLSGVFLARYLEFPVMWKMIDNLEVMILLFRSDSEHLSGLDPALVTLTASNSTNA